jgi:hypothetical protein
LCMLITVVVSTMVAYSGLHCLPTVHIDGLRNADAVRVVAVVTDY